MLHKDRADRRLLFTFVPQPEHGHFGYIQHVSSCKNVYPHLGSDNPDNNTRLVFYEGQKEIALFAFNEEKEVIQHIAGKIWHPYMGRYEGDGHYVVLYDDFHDQAKFYFGDEHGNKKSPYPKPTIHGEWRNVRAHINPQKTGTYPETYNIGKSQTKSVNTAEVWNVSIDYAKELFSASPEYSQFVERSNKNTWLTEQVIDVEVQVEAGKSFVVWQYVFIMTQFKEELTFMSDIYGHTNSENVEPTLSTAMSFYDTKE